MTPVRRRAAGNCVDAMSKKLSKPQHVVIECPQCEARTQAEVLAEREYPPDDFLDPHKYVFVECTGCHQVLVGFSEFDPYDESGWSPLSRQWPEPEQRFHANIPRSVRLSLEEAKKSFKAKAHMACAVMCGRAVEGICKDKVGAKYLGAGLKDLKNAKFIDEKLFEWGEALRAERNIGAHAGEDTISAQDANDVLDFAVAMSEYVYVLDDKYKAYKDRKAKKMVKKKS